ncbi:hypothetical protein QE152_g4956 [Popillia japonica]|uniref:DDE-1 domain-containing protein n=1 Tax=Popillia japonica TaxID=7064 RepID=A0AAW1MYF6_POPJA
MFFIAGDGTLLPLHNVYKSKHVHDAWTDNGPEGAIYESSKSGWFDGFLFERWFTKVALEYLRRCDDEKVIIGDNLASTYQFRACGIIPLDRNQVLKRMPDLKTEDNKEVWFTTFEKTVRVTRDAQPVDPLQQKLSLMRPRKSLQVDPLQQKLSLMRPRNL